MLGVNHRASSITFASRRALPSLLGATLACVSALGLCACGSSHKSATGAKVTQAARTSATSATAPTPTPVIDPADQRIVIARVGATAITKAAFERWEFSLAPKVASYEPRSREACSSVRAKLEVATPKLVDGHPPTSAELQRQCRAEAAEQLKLRVLQHLIASEWIVQEAARLGLAVSDAEASRVVEKDKRQQFASRTEFEKYMRQSRTSEAELHFNIKAQLAEERLRNWIKGHVGKLSVEQIGAYYDAHKAKYAKPERRDIEAIRTWTRTAIEKAKREVLSGANFGEIAKRVSIDHPSSEHGGVTLGVEPGQEEKGFDEAIFAARPNTLVGPLHLRRRYYIFEVKAVHPGHQTPYRQIEASISKEVEELRQQQAVASFIAQWRRRWIARTSCSAEYLVAKCRGARVTAAQRSEEDPYTFN